MHEGSQLRGGGELADDAVRHPPLTIEHQRGGHGVERNLTGKRALRLALPRVIHNRWVVHAELLGELHRLRLLVAGIHADELHALCLKLLEHLNELGRFAPAEAVLNDGAFAEETLKTALVQFQAATVSENIQDRRGERRRRPMFRGVAA